jgi:hypothetical protein
MKQLLLLLFIAAPVIGFCQSKTDKGFKDRERKFFDSVANEYQFDKVFPVEYDKDDKLELPAARQLSFVTPKKFTSFAEFEQYKNNVAGLLQRIGQRYITNVLPAGQQTMKIKIWLDSGQQYAGAFDL